MTKAQTRRVILFFLIDLVVLGLALCTFALFHHVMPRSIGNLYGSTGSGELLDFGEKFPGKFAAKGEVIREDGIYRDENVSLTLTTHEEDGVTYYVADFYLRHVTTLRTAMAAEEFTTGVADSVLNMAEENDALLAVSGDYFGIRQRGIVIRNGEIYRKTKAHQICILYAVVNGYLKEVPVAQIKDYEADLYGYMDEYALGVLENIRTTGQLSKEDEETLKQALTDFTKKFLQLK